MLRDVTERKQLEYQLHQSAKMEALGKLAGGLAHDFNNLLSVIVGYGQFALEGLPENAPIREELRQVLHAGKRATALTRQLLALSRTQLASPRVLDLNDAVIRVHRLLRPLLGAEVELIAELSEGLWPVRIDLGQLEQILINLAINAREAMPSGGKLFFITSNHTIESHGENESIAPGPYVVLRVRDTGPGIPPEVRAHLFEPFVTTKAPGQGTGLGLATTQCIVRDAGGSICVENALRVRHDVLHPSAARARGRSRVGASARRRGAARRPRNRARGRGRAGRARARRARAAQPRLQRAARAHRLRGARGQRAPRRVASSCC